MQAGEVVGIDLIDHLIVAGHRYYSFLEGGQLR
jgi:DNA repair protein RadC